MDAGELVVKTVVDNRNAEKGLKDLRKQLQATDEKLAELQKQQQGYGELVRVYEKEIDGLKDVEQEYDKVTEKLQEVANKRNEIFDMPESKAMEIVNSDYFNELDSQYRDLIKQQQELGSKKTSGLVATEKLEEAKAIYKDINNQLKDVLEEHNRYNDAIKETESAIKKAEIAQVFKQQTKEIGKSIKSIAKMGLAIFGIRSAYYMIRSAINDIGKSNKNVTDTIQYAKSMLSTALEPVVISIVNWLKQALAYINALIKAWFKRDLFAETNANLKKANKQASALKKTLAGFDEMNILNSPSSGGGGGISSSDLGLPSVEENGIFKWILDNKDKVIAAIMGITTALVATKLLGLQPLQGILLAITTYGLVTLVENIFRIVNDPSWDAFGGILEGLGLSIAGITGLLMVIGVASGPIGWIITAVGVLTAGIGLLIQNLESNASAVHDVQSAEEELANSRANRQNAEKQYTDAIKNQEKAHRDLQKAEKDTKLSGEEVYKMVETGKKKYEELTEPQRKVYDAYLNEQIALGNVDKALENLNEKKQQELKDKYDTLIANDEEGKSYQQLKEDIIKAVDEEKLSVEQAQDLISKMLSDIGVTSEDVFLKDVPDNIKKGLDASKYDNTWKRFGRTLREKIIEGFGQLTLGGTFSLIKLVGSVIKGAKGLMYYPKIPKLAVGGIINQPGRGIPYRGATIGERGAEAVVPLTDSQQMELLGATIGRYITINNTNPIYMNGRLIAKEINRSNAEDDFAFNR